MVSPSDIEQRNLVVVGAAAGIGRWLGDQVLYRIPWASVLLIDVAESIFDLTSSYACPTFLARSQPSTTSADPAIELRDFDRSLLNPPKGPLVVCLAVPAVTLAETAAWLRPMLPSGSVVFDLAPSRVQAGRLFPEDADIAHFGVHALFGLQATGIDGQTFVVCPSETNPAAHEWFVRAVEDAGATANVLSARRHDEIMQFVQTATHQSLLCFADLIGRSGLDLEADLWANRTPVFELMLALTSRVLSPGQEATTAAIQTMDGERVAATAHRAAAERLDAVLLHTTDPDSSALVEHIQSLRAPFSGGLFSKIQGAATLATSAVQATRARIASHRRSGAVLGVVSLGDGDRLHVGRVERVSATSFVLRDLLVGRRGAGAVLTDAITEANARRLGITGKARSVEFRLGRVQLLTDAELDISLNHWLAQMAKGCKFLVPESISGASAVRVVESVHGVEGAELISEEVRLGQRACVVRFHARVDRHLDDVERAIQHRIDEVFVWPDGVLSPLHNPDVSAIAFLGPAGTFSDVAARQLARLLRMPDVRRIEHADFPSLVGSVGRDQGVIGVLPITNSSSGLVDLAAAVLLGADRVIEAGGVLDVPVRFDAYVAPGTEPAPGDPVFSHPQGLRQCSSFIAASHFVEHIANSTAEACQHVTAAQHGVALAAPGVGEEAGLALHRASVGNLAGALTRFLVIGPAGTFHATRSEDATARSVWLLAPGTEVAVSNSGSAPHFDEVLRGPSGASLVVSTLADRITSGPGVREIGRIPWSPRTPIVIV